MTVQTQKAKGVKVIAQKGNGSWGYCSAWAAGSSHVLLHELPSQIEKEHFARPCPFRPRHGFVESRVVRGPEEIFGVVRETLEEDPQGEVILSPVINAKWSAVGTPNQISLGKGNDGATSGIAEMTLPLWEGEGVEKIWLERAGLEKGDTPYFEMVFGRLGGFKSCFTELVQVRAGPAIPQGVRNFIPEAVEVQNILQPAPGEDLLDWERRVLAAKRENLEGLVIYTPGVSLASHWAVHGIQHGLPVYTEWPLSVGMRLEPEVFKRPEPSEDELKDLAVRLGEVEFGWPYPNPESALHLTLLTLHHSMLWGWGPKENALRAHAVVSAVALAMVACLGELRHWWGQGPGRPSIQDEPATDIEFLKKKSYTPERSATYDWLLTTMKWEEAEKLWAPMVVDLSAGKWCSSYGGKKWAMCAKRSAQLWNKIQIFRKGPTPKRWERVVAQLNLVVNTAHNGGRLYTKWLSNRDFIVPVSLPSLCVGEALGEVLGLGSLNWEAPRKAKNLWEQSQEVEEEVEEEKKMGEKAEDPLVTMAKKVLDMPNWPYDPYCGCTGCKTITKKMKEFESGQS